MTTSRRRMLSGLGLGLSLPLVLTLAGCAAAPTRVPRLLRLEAEPRPEPGGATDLSAAPVWHLQRVQLPAYLDRELVLAGQGAGSLQALPEVRWAEPLAEARHRPRRWSPPIAARCSGWPRRLRPRPSADLDVGIVLHAPALPDGSRPAGATAQ